VSWNTILSGMRKVYQVRGLKHTASPQPIVSDSDISMQGCSCRLVYQDALCPALCLSTSMFIDDSFPLPRTCPDRSALQPAPSRSASMLVAASPPLPRTCPDRSHRDGCELVKLPLQGITEAYMTIVTSIAAPVSFQFLSCGVDLSEKQAMLEVGDLRFIILLSQSSST
jgi:hypothetical protein